MKVRSICNCGFNSSPVDLTPIERDEKLSFVLGPLVESRYHPESLAESSKPRDAASSAASILACQRLKTAYALDLLQLARSRGP